MDTRTTIEANYDVVMHRPHLNALPSIPTIAPFRLRWYRPGDEAHWLRIHEEADQYNTFPPEVFEQQFGWNKHVLLERQCYLTLADGHPIGTASAWFPAPEDDPAWGRIHWVAISPDYQGRGLSKALLSVICHRLQRLLYQAAYLHTSTARVAAINLYRSFGFEPYLRHDRDRTVWQALAPALKLPLPQ